MYNTLVIDIAKYLIIIPPILSLVLLWRVHPNSRRLKYAGLVVLTGLIALALAKLSSVFINDPRPFVVGHFTPLIAHAANNGFPSDHTLLGAALGFAALPVSRRYGIIILILAAIIGAARVLAGVHHVEDIVGSFVISAIAFGIAYGLGRLYVSRKAARQPEA